MDTKDKPESIRDIIINTFIEVQESQLKTLRKLQKKQAPARSLQKGMSQVEMVYDILQRSGRELHITDIIQHVKQIHGIKLERESIVSALTKKVKRGDRFLRTGRNTFSLKKEE